MRFALVKNVGCSNGVISIGVSPSLKIAAAIWIAARIDSIASTRTECLKFALQRLREHYPKWELWLVAGHRAVQPDNRVTRHFGLWKGLEKRGIDIPSGDFLEEALVPSEGGMRVFGAVRFTSKHVERTSGVLSRESAAIVALDGSLARDLLKGLIVRGWSQNNTNPPEEILESVCSAGGVVISLFGEFDDVEVAAAVMGNEELVASLAH